jgi:folate-dependent phosphoribosylglycinamide formyltransferase PurN
VSNRTTGETSRQSRPEATVVVLGARDGATRALYHSLEAAIGSHVTIRALLEAPPSRLSLARRRIHKLGWWTVVGQVAFIVLVMPVLRLSSRRRVGEIANECGFDFGPIEGAEHVGSVNDAQTVSRLQALKPTVVVVHGTRIISDHVLRSIDVPIVNVHVGITPWFRGVHGGYWALVEEHPELVGTTVHLIDAGIDTGGILGQATFQPSERDNIASYPYLHLACVVPVLADVVTQLITGASPQVVLPLAGAERSVLRSHPTAWGYLMKRVRQRVR